MNKMKLIALAGIVPAALSATAGLFSPAPTKKVSDALQPEARVFVKRGSVAWKVADWNGMKAETKAVDAPLAPGGRAISAEWRRGGKVVRKETYPLPTDAKALEAELREEAMRIVIPFDMPFDGKATIAIDTPDGVRVRNLVNGIPYGKGRHEVVWDGYREDGTLADAGEYRTRIAVHPGLSYEYLGYFACGGDPDQWNAWGPNHLPFLRTLRGRGRVAASTYFTEGGHSTVVLGLDGHYMHGWGDNWFNANDSIHLVDGLSGERFYAVRGSKEKKELSILAYSWTAERKYNVRFAGEVGPCFPAGAAVVGDTLYVANAETKTLDKFRIDESDQGTTVFEKIGSDALDSPGALDSFDGKLVTAPEPGVISFDTDGREIFAVKEGSDVIHVYDFATKAEKRTIGVPGGFATGAWNADRLVSPSGVALDEKGFLWVAENRFTPKRLSRWDAKAGKCVYEKFGSSAYGYPGMGMDSEDPSRWMAYDVLWHVDDKAKTDHPVAIVHEPQDPVNPLPVSAMHYTWFRRSGRTFVMGYDKATTMYELKDGRFQPLALVSCIHAYLVGLGRFEEKTPCPPAIIAAYRRYHPEFKDRSDADTARALRYDRRAFFWKDLNRDGKMQEGEIELEMADVAGGYWGYWAESLDFNYPVSVDGKLYLLRFDAGDMKGDSLPDWSLSRAFGAKKPLAGSLPAGECSLGGEAMTDVHGRTVLLGMTPYMLGIGPEGRIDWSMYNPFPGVHGAQKASLPVPGELQGLLFSLGTVPYSKTADVFATINDHGRMFFITTDGLYIDEMFSDCRVSAKMDESTVGGEAFGGSFHYDKVNKKCVLQAGGYRKYNIIGLDKVRETRGKLKVSVEQMRMAAAHPPRSAGESRPQSAALPGRVSWSAGANHVGVETDVAGENLRFRFNVQDPSPWVNNGLDRHLMFKTGDCVDVQFIDRNGLPVRVMLSPAAGNPGETQLTFYRHTVPEAERAKAHPQDFSSPWRTHHAEDVTYPDWPRVVHRGQGAYNAEVSVPLSLFSANGDIKIDVGVIYGDEEGKINLSRSYWSNKETGLVNDVPGEIIPQPEKWGTFARAGSADAAKDASKDSSASSSKPVKLRRVGYVFNQGGVTTSRAEGWRPGDETPTVGPVYDADEGVLYMGGSFGSVNAIGLDGRLRATYTLPECSRFGYFDRMVRDPASGDVYLNVGGTAEAGTARNHLTGHVYRIPAHAASGTPAEIVASNVTAISSKVMDGKILLVRRGGELASFDVRTRTEAPYGKAEIDGADYYTCMYDWMPSGKLVACIMHQNLWEFEGGRTNGVVRPIFGEREIKMGKGFILGDIMWSLTGGTVKRYRAESLQAAPGVVLGGASGYFLGRVDNFHELNASGICPLGGELFAIGSGENADCYVFEYDHSKGKLVALRRLGPVVDPWNLAIDRDGWICCDNMVWPWTARSSAPPTTHFMRMPERGAAVLPNGTFVRIMESHGARIEAYHGKLCDGEMQITDWNRNVKDFPEPGDHKRPDGSWNWAQVPVRTDVAESGKVDGRTGYELRTFYADGLVKCYRVSENGEFAQEDFYREYRHEGNVLYAARDGDSAVVTDREKGTVTLFAKGAGGKRVRVGVAEGLKGPTKVAISNRRLVVYEADAQRLVKFEF